MTNTFAVSDEGISPGVGSVGIRSDQQTRGEYLYRISELIPDEMKLINIGNELDVPPEEISRIREDNQRDIHTAALTMLQSWSNSVQDDTTFMERLTIAFQNIEMGTVLDVIEPNVTFV